MDVRLWESIGLRKPADPCFTFFILNTGVPANVDGQRQVILTQLRVDSEDRIK